MMMTHKQTNLQDRFLTQAQTTKAAVTLFLMNGYQLRGIIRDFDAFAVLLTTDNKQQFICKHAISTIIPEKPLELSGEGVTV